MASLEAPREEMEGFGMSSSYSLPAEDVEVKDIHYPRCSAQNGTSIPITLEPSKQLRVQLLAQSLTKRQRLQFDTLHCDRNEEGR